MAVTIPILGKESETRVACTLYGTLVLYSEEQQYLSAHTYRSTMEHEGNETSIMGKERHWAIILTRRSVWSPAAEVTPTSLSSQYDTRSSRACHAHKSCDASLVPDSAITNANSTGVSCHPGVTFLFHSCHDVT